MNYIIYKITNLINGKIYIGCHKCIDINDDYMGSGTVLKRAQQKYGIEKFKKETLYVFDNPVDMFEMESRLVNEEFIGRDDVYNITLGGNGGFHHINIDNDKYLEQRKANGKKSAFREASKKIEYLRENDKQWVENLNLKISNSLKEYYKINSGSFKNKTHSEDTKKKIGEKNSISQIGSRNSQFGTMWIYNLELKESKKIKKDVFPDFEKLGWLKGRKIKF